MLIIFTPCPACGAGKLVVSDSDARHTAPQHKKCPLWIELCGKAGGVMFDGRRDWLNQHVTALVREHSHPFEITVRKWVGKPEPSTSTHGMTIQMLC